MKPISLLFFIITLFFVSDSFSYPRFSAYSGDKCADCHVSPTGASMRNSYGYKFAKENLHFEAFKEMSKETEFSPQLNKEISAGGDVRFIAINDQINLQPNMNTFLTMQGDLYINAKVNKVLNVFVTAGIESPNIPMKYEVYGMVSHLPLKSYIRAGRFSPGFGIRVVEHRSYQRGFLLSTPFSADAGIEAGFSPGIFNFSMGLFNGLNTDFFDKDPNKMFVTSADLTFGVMEDKININFGGSFYNNPYNTSIPNTGNISSNRKAMGGFTKLGFFNRVALLGEMDFAETQIGSDMSRRLFGFGELDLRLFKGFELRSQFEYMDPNRDIDKDHITRLSFGAAVFPFLGLEAEAMYRIVTEEIDIKNDEMQVNLHFYF